MDLRPYRAADRAACLVVFDSNAPASFNASERAGFQAFLDGLDTSHPDGAYFVMEHDNAVVGCGGYRAGGESSADLTWGIVHRESQRLGLGRFLLLYRLREIGKLSHIHVVRASIPHHAAPFFASQGFREAASGTNPDRVEMLKKLTVCT